MSTSKIARTIFIHPITWVAVVAFLFFFLLTASMSDRGEDKVLAEELAVLATGTIDRQVTVEKDSLPTHPGDQVFWSQVVPQGPEEYTGWEDIDAVPDEVGYYTRSDNTDEKLVEK